MIQFQSENPCLNRIQPAVVALYVVVILLRLAMVAQHPYSLRQVWIVGRDCASLTASTQILAGIKTESRCLPHRSSSFPAFVFLRKVLGAMSLAGIFQYDETPSFSQFSNPIHVGRLSAEVNGHHRRNYPAGATRNRPSSKLVLVALRLQVLAEFFRVHIVGALIYVDELRLCTSLGNSFGGSDESVWHGEYAIARADPCGHKGETRRICPAAHTDAIVHLAELRKRVFKILYRLASYEGSGVQCSSKNGD